MNPDEMESEIYALKTQVSELEAIVTTAPKIIPLTYEELFTICKDIFEQTVDTDLECVEDENFGLPYS